MKTSLLIAAVAATLISSLAVHAQANSASVTAHCRSLGLRSFRGLHPQFGILVNYVTTYDGEHDVPLYDIIEGDFENSEELRPVPGQLSPTTYQADYLTLVEGELVAYGEFTINLPATDEDGNGLPDIVQKNKATLTDFSGTGKPDFREGGLPLYQFQINNGYMVRQAYANSGQYVLTMSEPLGSVTYDGTYYLTYADGTAVYSRGVSNQITFALTLTSDEEKITVSGRTSFTVLNANRITLPEFNLISSAGPATARPFILTRHGNSYRGNMQLLDGELGTSWPDYTDWHFEITDPHDSDGDGVPDLSDSMEPPPRPTLIIEVSQAGMVRIRLTGEAQRTYSLEGSSDLTNWAQVGPSLHPNSGGVLLFPEIPVSGSTYQFYRCRVL